MSEIVCPHCSAAFTVDEAGYAALIQQVRNSEFKKELQQRLALADNEKQTAVELAKSEISRDMQTTVSAKDSEISDLKARLSAVQTEQKLAITEAVGGLEKERNEREDKLKNVALTKDTEINELKAKLNAVETEQKLAINEAVGKIEKKNTELTADFKRIELEKQLSENALKEKYETQIKDRDAAIERLKDLKSRLSTKMVGESLEQHCENEFNRIRSTAFPFAYFEKDNDARTGSKGDYIFRDYDEENTEIVSIMFEMKNEVDTTATKKKNEDFLKELDKDRAEKGCEYAILVSMLEPDSELYNTGIVDVFHRYPKMYVIRPQFFVPIITLLRNASLKSLSYKKDLEIVKAQNIDITNFESKLDTFKNAFSKNYDLASRKFDTAIAEIDKSISHLTKTKDALLSADRNLRLANNKAQDVTIKRLTRNNPTMAQKFIDATDAKEQ